MGCLQQGPLLLALLLALTYFGTASAALRWPTDSQLRTSLLTKRGLGLYEDDKVAKLQFLKVRWFM